ncbi:hypothetical protein D9M68_516330 [compost metagenome]
MHIAARSNTGVAAHALAAALAAATAAFAVSRPERGTVAMVSPLAGLTTGRVSTGVDQRPPMWLPVSTSDMQWLRMA